MPSLNRQESIRFNKEIAALWKNWWRRIWRQRIEVKESLSAALVARQYGLDRRGSIRIHLPKTNQHLFPRIIFQGQEMPVVDMSVGGVCLIDTQDLLSSHLSQEISIRIEWCDFNDTLEARVVGVSRHTHRHLQFLLISTKSVELLKNLVSYGGLGQKISQVLTLPKSPAQLDVAELWTGLEGSGLIFFQNQDLDAELSLKEVSYRFYRNHPPLKIELNGETRPMNQDEIANVVLCLANIPQPSLRLLTLLSDLVGQPDPLKSTGSGP